MEIDAGGAGLPSLRDGGDPAARSYGERIAAPCKPLKNALDFLKLLRGRNNAKAIIFSVQRILTIERDP